MTCLLRLLCLVLALLSFPVFGAAVDKLSTEFASSTLIMNGVTTAPEGRRFGVVQPLHGGQPQVAEITSGSAVAYPDSQWSAWRNSEDPRRSSVTPPATQ